MKLLPLFLAVSVATNAALLVAHLNPENESGGGEAGGPRAAAGTAGGVGAAGMAGAEGAGAVDGGPIARALQSGDVERLRDELRAAGVEEDLVRAVVGMRIWKRYEARMKALQASGAAGREWWKNDHDWWGGQSKAQRAEMKALQEEIKAESERLLGKDAGMLANNPWLERQYGFLPAEKREALMKLEQDYNELSQEMQKESQGFSLPSDREKAKFILAEKRADLEAMLTPEELADYDLRQSNTAQQLRWQMTQMDATEEEFRTIFAIRKPFDELYNNQDPFGGRRNMKPEDWKARGEAEKAMKAQIREALGEERYLEYARSQDHDYQQLKKATQRFGLPADTPAKVFAMRSEIPAEAVRIADDATLTVEQKKAEAVRLAAAARERVRGLLGAEVAEAYFEQNGMQWVQQLEQGNIITFTDDGGQQHRRIDQVMRRPATAK